eukprot:6430373-Alexandrium_andersonii.AAC.1
MSASLVGSEMCIRDSFCNALRGPPRPPDEDIPILGPEEGPGGAPEGEPTFRRGRPADRIEGRGPTEGECNEPG